MITQDTQELFGSAKDYFREGHYEIAGPMLEQLLIMDPLNSEVHYMAATFYLEKGHLGKALHFFKKSLELDPGFTDASIGLSILLNDLGQYEKAQKVFEKAYTLTKQKDSSRFQTNEKLAQKHRQLGDMYLLQGRYKQALENYNRSFNLSKNRLQYGMKAIDCLIQMELMSQALKEAQNLQASYPKDYDLLFKIAQIHHQLGDQDQAKIYWKKALLGNSNRFQTQNHFHPPSEQTFPNP